MAMVIKMRVPRWLERAALRPMEIYHSIRLRSDVRLIPLSKWKFAIVDRAEYEELNKKKWYVQESEGLYAIHREKGKTIWMHRMLMNAPKDKKVDHRNNDSLDNRIENLRVVSNSENNKNRRKMRGNFTSKYKGVFWDKRRKCWVARINVNGRLIHIGSFKDEVKAARAYDEAAKKYHGEFARPNFSNITLPQRHKGTKILLIKNFLSWFKERIMTKLQKGTLISLTIIIGITFGCAKESEKPAAQKIKPALKTDYTADWESLKQRNPSPEWFRDAKFGIYFHWGVYTVPAFGNEWYPRNMYDLKSPEYKHHVKTWGEPNVFGYPDFVPMFKAEKFDANEWADLFVKTGARFAGPVAEHHDGFSMWASKLTPWNAKDMGPHRDCVGELEKAIRGRGMRFVTTFHHERNGLYEITKDGKTYWTGHYEFVKKNFPELLEDPCRAIMYGYMPAEKFYQMWEDKLLEVIDHYHPDLMYFDSWLDEIPDKYKMDYLAHYFNDAGKSGKEVVVTYKQEDLPKGVGMEDYEKGRADKLTDYVWLTDDTISRGSWCWTEGLGIKKPAEIVRTMIDIVSKNGQLMLNISPKADGTIPDNQKEVLLAIGDWMSKYGEAIYETRPFVDYGEGPTKMQSGGGFARMQGGYNAKDIRYTRKARKARKGNTVYAMALGWPGENQKITMTIFGKEGKAGNIKVKKVTMLGTNKKIKWQRTDAGLVVTTPAKGDSMANVFKLTIGE